MAMNEKSTEGLESSNTMPDVPLKLEENVKRQLQQVIAEFVDSYRHAIFDSERIEHPYEYHMKVEPLNWSDDMIRDIANIFLSKTLDMFSDVRLQEEMADDLKVLLDEEKSNRWLCRIAKAERSSVAYERGSRLIGDGKNINRNVVAREILQRAANAGDELCAMRLIESTYAQLIQRNKQCGETPIVQQHNQHEETPSYKSAFVAVCSEAGDIAFANDKLQKEVDVGDIESALFLIEQVMINRIKEKRVMIGEDVGAIVGYKGLSIAWSEERIHEFLLKRYDAGDEKAKRLLKLKLLIDVSDKLGGDKLNTSKRSEVVKNTKGYPASIIQEVLNGNCCDESDIVNIPCPNENSEDIDEFPF